MESSEHKSWICGEQWMLQQKLDLWRAAKFMITMSWSCEEQWIFILTKSWSCEEQWTLELKRVGGVKSCGHEWIFTVPNWRSCENIQHSTILRSWSCGELWTFFLAKCQSFEEQTAVLYGGFPYKFSNEYLFFPYMVVGYWLNTFNFVRKLNLALETFVLALVCLQIHY